MATESLDQPQECIERLGKLISDIPFAMLATVASDGSIHSRPMASQQNEFSGELWFFTGRDSGKVFEIEKDQHVNVAYASPSDQIYVSISGQAEVVDDRAKAAELWNPAYKAWFPEGLEDPNLALLRVRVMSAEYWDSPSSKLVQLVGFVKAVTTGEPYKPGPKEHGRIDLQH